MMHAQTPLRAGVPSRPLPPRNTGRNASRLTLLLSCCLFSAIVPTPHAHAAAVVDAKTHVTDGPAGSNTAILTATFSLRQAAQAGVMGGQKVTLTVNFWQDNTFFDDFLGSTTVTVTLPPSGNITGPFTTPPVTVTTEHGTNFYSEVKAGGGVGGASFVMAPTSPSSPPEGPGEQRALASLAPPPGLVHDPQIGSYFGNRMALASIQTEGDRILLILEPNLPPLPRTGAPYDIYVAQLATPNNSTLQTLGVFPTIVEEDTSDVGDQVDLRNAGKPVFEAFDITDVPLSQFDRILITARDLDGTAGDLPVLAGPIADLCPPPFNPADVDHNGKVEIRDAVRVLRAVLGLTT